MRDDTDRSPPQHRCACAVPHGDRADNNLSEVSILTRPPRAEISLFLRRKKKAAATPQGRSRRKEKENYVVEQRSTMALCSQRARTAVLRFCDSLPTDVWAPLRRSIRVSTSQNMMRYGWKLPDRLLRYSGRHS